MKDCTTCDADGFINHVECTACRGYGEIECYEGEHKEAAEWDDNRTADMDYCFGDDRYGPYPGRDKNSRFYN